MRWRARQYLAPASGMEGISSTSTCTCTLADLIREYLAIHSMSWGDGGMHTSALVLTRYSRTNSVAGPGFATAHQVDFAN